MAGGKQKLTARAAATTKPGRYGDGDGLYLVVAPSGARKWVYSFTYAGKVTEAGLGSADVVLLPQRETRPARPASCLRPGKTRLRPSDKPR